MPLAAQDPRFSVQDIPFSYRESWFGISPVIAEKTSADDLHLVSHQTGMHAVLRLGAPSGATVTATPAMLSWEHSSGVIDLAYEDTSTIRIRSTGAALRIAAATTSLTPFGGSYLYRDPVDGSHVFTSYETGRRYRVTVITGTLTAAGVERLGDFPRHLDLAAGEPWEVAVEEYETAREPYRARAAFDQVASTARTAFEEFADAVAPWRGPETPAAELAAYVIWSATVAPGGFLARPAVLMSKHWMDKVWSWDHCFNALALAEGDPELAWHQFQLPFDHQDPTGALPDSVTHSEVLYNFVKPPIHGWALSRLRQLLPVTPEALADTYERLAHWTEFWLNRRRVPGHDLPHYQHGNDSGWDNATTFDSHRTLETADLAGFLILQLRELAAVATELGRAGEANRWTAIAEEVRSALLRELWRDGQFVSRNPATGQESSSRSLLDLMAITLGDDLPPEVRDALAARLSAHLTPHGLATEPVDSPDYSADGYWRGPIWAPSTVLIEDGLRRGGHPDLADEISRRFRALCEKSGFAENFDAETGAGLRDRAYTWTAAAYLILARAHKARTSSA
ncbi:amylo-alpha-1,6-glucosidase [Actinoplanes sp. GCM10030250]|uniref:amylo-alpha-1,6-glucosidase n=1 Tax=Actinoplanes sp. GCM10030250 TaxID=3273376 RepID=UPI003615760E